MCRRESGNIMCKMFRIAAFLTYLIFEPTSDLERTSHLQAV